MPIDFEKAIGYEKTPAAVSWNQRDLLLYAAGIGAKRNELSTLFELHKDWQPFPTYPLVLGKFSSPLTGDFSWPPVALFFIKGAVRQEIWNHADLFLFWPVSGLKGDSGSVNDFSKAKDAGGATPGLPVLNPKKLVHAEQSIWILKPLPADSGKGWKLRKQSVGVKDTGKGLIVDDSQELVGPDGEVYARMISSGYAFGDYTKNEPKWKGFQKSIAPKQPTEAANKPPSRKPDVVFSEKTTEEQAILYRLSGDYNPLHIEPWIGKELGFPGAILHGLCSYGHAARALVLNTTGGDGSKLVYMSARFTSPVMPGDELETSMWFSSEGENTRVDFIQKIVQSGKTCLGGGVALVKGKASKL
ncbi:BQ2448_2211 [Microbotryum intermedium]|uniref:BQ2448_2211 protein n=1 Tax=Microbotryum intermedium TaxID=269621 RepID=A0A238FAT5_9BASI|nr:BQ2448_2211 [Microbotryum intermedium]